MEVRQSNNGLRNVRVFERIQEEGDGMSGFYFAHRLTDEIGLSFAFVYIPEERGIQISLMFGCLMLAIGYNGREVTE